MPAPTPMEEFFFDLRGYCILPKALDADHLKELNDWADALPGLENGEWLGNMEAHTCLLYTSPSPRDGLLSRMPSSA